MGEPTEPQGPQDTAAGQPAQDDTGLPQAECIAIVSGGDDRNGYGITFAGMPEDDQVGAIVQAMLGMEYGTTVQFTLGAPCLLVVPAAGADTDYYLLAELQRMFRPTTTTTGILDPEADTGMLNRRATLRLWTFGDASPPMEVVSTLRGIMGINDARYDSDEGVYEISTRTSLDEAELALRLSQALHARVSVMYRRHTLASLLGLGHRH